MMHFTSQIIVIITLAKQNIERKECKKKLNTTDDTTQ